MAADENFIIYHNPRCSKSRATLQLLRERGIEPEIVEYLKSPPAPEQLRELAAKLGLDARSMLRRGEREYKELGLDDTSVDEARLFEAMSEHPRLIERPIVVAGERAVHGRPPENVEQLLD